MKCSSCPSQKIFARGMCQACYYRLRRNGTTARKNMVNEGVCSHAGCGRQALARNLCTLHYQRSQHPLRNTWMSLRSRYPGQFPEDWGNLEVFAKSVGERPSPAHQLRRLDFRKPWSTENMEWREPIGVSSTTEAKAYAWRWHLRNRYGITVERVEEMATAQDGRCAVCGAILGAPDPKGKPSKVCVDHDHVTRKVRGLLCDPCNKGLGAFNDSLPALRAAIAYLESHAG